MRKVVVVVCLMMSLVMLAGCAGKSNWDKNMAQKAALNTTYGIRSMDGKILLDVTSKSSLTFNGVTIKPSHAVITELHNRLSAQSGRYDTPEQLNANHNTRDKSEWGSSMTFLVNVMHNETDNRIYVNFFPRTIDAGKSLKYVQDNKYPKIATLSTTCEGMSADECSRAISKEAVDFFLPDFERIKDSYLKWADNN